MGQFKKTSNISGKIKGLMIHDGVFINAETGERIDVVKQLQSVYGDETFDLSTSLKIDEDIDV